MTGILAREVAAKATLARVLIWAGLCVGVVGCGGGDGSNPPRVRVTGKITLDGEPAPAGFIEFIPVGPGQLQSQGIVSDDGTFSLDETGGPSPGEYKVEIRCAKKTGRRVQSMSSSDGTGMIDERVPVIPSKYHSPTVLRQTITAGDNVVEFKLASK
jgi:hypothetical protein